MVELQSRVVHLDEPTTIRREAEPSLSVVRARTVRTQPGHQGGPIIPAIRERLVHLINKHRVARFVCEGDDVGSVARRPDRERLALALVRVEQGISDDHAVGGGGSTAWGEARRATSSTADVRRRGRGRRVGRRRSRRVGALSDLHKDIVIIANVRRR